MTRSTLSIREALLVAVICFGLFIHYSVQAVLAGFPQARFSNAGNAWSIVLELMLAAAALLYLHSRNFDIASLYPAPGVPGTVAGVGIFFASWVIGALVVLPLSDPERAGMTEFSFRGLSLLSIVLFAMANGAFEEVFLLGVLVRGLRGYGLSIALGLPLLVRMLYHLYQGPLGVAWVLAVGFTFTLFYLRLRQLWPPVLAHVLWDIVPVLLAGH